MKYSSMGCLFSTVADQDLELHQMDVTTAFLDGKSEEDIYIEIPKGVQLDQEDIDEPGLDNDIDEFKKLDLVANLEKSMYGTKKAPRFWNKKISSVLAEGIGFKTSDADPCLYTRHDRDGIMMIAL